jgi:hypothetical protein
MAIKIQNSIVIYDDGVFKVGSGTTATRPASPVAGMMRYNSTLGLFELHDGTGWFFKGETRTLGVIHTNRNVINENATLDIPTNETAFSVGTVTVNDNISLTVPDNQEWMLII